MHVYAADTRHAVRLQFYPDGYEWTDAEPVLISQGFSGTQAGLGGAQQLPDKFRVTRSTGHDAPQDIFINREIDMESWLFADKVREECDRSCLSQAISLLAHNIVMRN